MSLFQKLFKKRGGPSQDQDYRPPVYSSEVVEGLQKGTIGSKVHPYLICLDLKGRDTKGIGRALTSAYGRMMRICPGLRTEPPKARIDTSGENNHWLSMTIRFAEPSEAPKHQAECVKILAEHGFE